MEMGHFDAAVVVSEVVAVAPLGVEELRALDDDLGQVDARAGVDFLGDHVDAGAEAEDEAGVGAVEDEVAAGEHDLAGGRYGDEGVPGAHFGFGMAGGDDFNDVNWPEQVIGRRGGSVLVPGIVRNCTGDEEQFRAGLHLRGMRGWRWRSLEQLLQ